MTNLAGYGLAQMPKFPRSSPNPVRVIDVLTYPAVQLLDVTGPVQVFASANDLVVDAGGTPPYLLKVVAQGGDGATASAGVTLAAGPLTKGGEALDTLLVAGGEGAEAAAENPVLVDWVRQRATRARRVASVCTGAFLLAAAGLLDGRRAATHWKYCAKLAQRFPAVHVEPDPIFVCDGPVCHLGDDLSLSVPARQAGMSERSFSRHYAQATGLTPARAIEQLRVEAARRLLSETRTPVKRIAQRCGFGSEETMRRSFLRLLAVTPQDYRSRFTF
jgi:transcriptional regulator GlxA family with amidase domain